MFLNGFVWNVWNAFECGDVCFCWLRFNVDVAGSVSGNMLEPDFHFQIKTIRQKKTEARPIEKEIVICQLPKKFSSLFFPSYQ